MHEASNELGRAARPELARVRRDIVEADEKFTVKARIGFVRRVLGVIERNDIGGAFMAEELLIDARHFRGRDKMNAKLEFPDVKVFGQKSAGDAL